MGEGHRVGSVSVCMSVRLSVSVSLSLSPLSLSLSLSLSLIKCMVCVVSGGSWLRRTLSNWKRWTAVTRM